MKRRDIYSRFSGHCAYCGKKIEFDDMTIDHIIPQSKGGKDTAENTVPAYQLCNNQKADRTIEEFRDFIADLTNVLDENKQYRLAIRYKKVVPIKPSVTFYFESHK